MAQDKAKGKRKQAGEKARPQAQILPQQLLEGLELTDEQKAKLEVIAKEMRAPVTEARKAIDDLLTDEQKEARKAAQSKAKEEGKKPQEAQKAVEEALKLTEEQKEKMAKLKEKQAEVQKQVRDKVMEVLTPEQQKVVEEKMKKTRGAGAKGGKGKKAAAAK
jgi:Spy/CpxP family protein refolding chaperone